MFHCSLSIFSDLNYNFYISSSNFSGGQLNTYRLLLLLLTLIVTVTASTISYADDGLDVSISIIGVKGAELENIKAHLSYSTFNNSKQKEVSVRRWYKVSKSKIKNSLEALGYYSAEVKSDYQKDDGIVNISFNISLNERIVIAAVDAQMVGEGANDDDFIQVINDFNSLVGKKLQHDKYESIKAGLVNVAIEKGYFDAKFLFKKIEIFPEQTQCKIFIKFDSGPRYLFGEALFDKSKLSEQFLRKFVSFSYSDYYDAKKIIDLRAKLLTSQYFESVSVVRGKKNADSLNWPIIVSYQLKLKHKYDYGVGYGTDSGPRVSFGYQNRLVNESGHRYKFYTEYSPKIQQANFEYSFPDKDPLHDIYKFTLVYDREDIDFAKSTTFSTGIERVYIKENDWTRTVYLKYIQENFFIANEEGDAALLLPGINWMQGKSNNHLYPTKGWKGNIDLFGGIESIGSDFTMFQARARFKFIRGIFPSSRLILRTELGGTHIDDKDFDNLPLSLRFFAGGDSSVRGYDYKNLSPEVSGNKIGARYLVVGSAEMDYKFAEKWAGAVFIDSGNAINNIKDDLVNGIGFGVRWYSPVGPLKFDLAWPQDGETKDFRIHISIGPDL